MKIAIMGAAGFIGTNLGIALLKKISSLSELIVVDEKRKYFKNSPVVDDERVRVVTKVFDKNTGFDDVTEGVEAVFHLISSTNPTSSNVHISDEITDNIAVTVNLLESCVKNRVKKIIFVSSGGAIYGEAACPVGENADENPINTYGIQKIAIEKTLYLYNYLYGLDYRIARLSNPYGPFQRPNGRLGAVSTFTFRALNNEPIEVFGDGRAVRDYIYIDDAVNALINISFNDCKNKIYNIGSGVGVSLNELISKIKLLVNEDVCVEYQKPRKVDVLKNYLDTSRYQAEFGSISYVQLEEGIVRTADSLKKIYGGKE